MKADPDQKAKSSARLPLEGLVVLDLTLARAGPTCVRHLGDWGADIIRIEAPSAAEGDVTGRRDGYDQQNLHRNKRHVTLNLKTEEGHAALMKLVEKADVLIENMRTRVKHRLKIAWEDVHAVNPRLVYGSISGFGQTGPYSERAGVDQIAQGMGGLMSVTGLPGQGPVRAGAAVSDMTAGTLLALAVMMALFDRHRTGEGRWVHTSLLESQIFLLDFLAARWLVDHEVPKQAGNDHPNGIPMGVFPSSDGLFNIAAGSGRLWEGFCDAIGHPEWREKPEWATAPKRSADRKAINAAISEITKLKPTKHWVDLLEAAGIPCGPIYSIDQVFADPQVKHLGMAGPVHHPRLGDYELVATPINIDGFEKKIRSAPPEAGADTVEVLKSVGYTDRQIEAMRASGAI